MSPPLDLLNRCITHYIGEYNEWARLRAREVGSSLASWVAFWHGDPLRYPLLAVPRCVYSDLNHPTHTVWREPLAVHLMPVLPGRIASPARSRAFGAVDRGQPALSPSLLCPPLVRFPPGAT